MRRTVTTLLASLVVLLGIGAASANAAASRVVALEWDAVESLTALKVKPVGVADGKGYDAFVGIKRPSGSTDVGLRQTPNLEAIAALKPDLIIVPDFRSTTNRAQLQAIAPVLVTTPYPSGGGNGAQFTSMVRDFRRIADAVGRKADGEKVLKRMTDRFKEQKAALKKAKRANQSVVVAEPGGTTSAPALRLMTNNSLTAEVVRRIGLKNGWGGANNRFGFSTSGVGSLAKIKRTQWLAFIYPEQYRKQIQQFRELPAFAALPVVKARRYRNLEGRTWLYGGPLSAIQIADEVSRAIRRGKTA